MDSISRLMNPRSVAVIGASGDAQKTSGRPIAFLRKHGFAGRLYPVNPRYAEIDGLTCYPNIAALPEVPDAAIILLGPERANQAVAELAAMGTPAAIVLAGGYGEAGEEGIARQQALQAARGNMRVLGPNTIGLINLTQGITLSASGALDQEALRAGNIAVISQSGGILGSILSRGAAAGIGFSKLVATSNEVDLDVADFVDYLWMTRQPTLSPCIWKGFATRPSSAVPRSRRALPANRSSSSRSDVPRPVPARRRPIPAPWPVPTRSTMSTSNNWALFAPRPLPTCSTCLSHWPAGARWRAIAWRF